MKAAGATGAGLAVGSAGYTGTVGADHLIPTPQLETDGNLLVDPQGNTVTLRGVNIVDPRRADVLQNVRGKNAVQMVEMLTDPNDGWYSQVIRVPLQPSDIARAATGYAAGPMPPGEISQSDIEEYCRDHVDAVVDKCEERGAYVILDYHRHWTANSSLDDRGFDGYWAEGGEDGPGPQAWYESLQQECVDFWDVVAERYGERSHTLFEVYNEPTEPGMWGDPQQTGWVGEVWPHFAEFMQAPVDQIEAHTSNLQILGSPSWTQSPEGLLLTEDNIECYSCDFNQLDEPENLGASYHIYPAHTASKNDDWEDVSEANNGEGVDGVYEEYPLFVTEFGYDATLEPGRRDSDENYPLEGDLSGFGEAFMEWMESSDAIHWTAWCGDIWWDTTMFERGEEGWESTTETDIENPYEGDIPNDCPEPPCEWHLLGEDVGDDETYMGAWIKDRLAEYRDHNNPAGDPPEHDNGGGEEPSAPSGLTTDATSTSVSLSWNAVSDADSYNVYRDGEEVDSTASTSHTFTGLDPETEYEVGVQAENSDGTSSVETVSVTTPGDTNDCEDSMQVDGQTVCNVDGDQYYRDVNGDGNVGNRDVGAFFENFHLGAFDRDEFDYSGNGRVSHGDVVALFNYV